MDSTADYPKPTSSAKDVTQVGSKVTFQEMVRFKEPTGNLTTLHLSSKILGPYDPTCKCVICAQSYNPKVHARTLEPVKTSASARVAWHQGDYTSEHLLWVVGDSVDRLAETHAFRRDHRRITGSDKCPVGITGGTWREYLQKKEYLAEWEALVKSPGYTAETCGAQTGGTGSTAVCENLVRSDLRNLGKGGPFRSKNGELCCDARHAAKTNYSATRVQNKKARGTLGDGDTSAAAGASAPKPWVSILKWRLRPGTVERHAPTCMGTKEDGTLCGCSSFNVPKFTNANKSVKTEMAKVSEAQRAFLAPRTDTKAAEVLGEFLSPDELEAHYNFLTRYEELRALLGLSYCPNHRKEWDTAHPEMLDTHG
ncbi:uncharacterized protein MKK02DRAFT_42171 [Dioszegia hungarica]|uniref:Uncharacterized protein n=1 Tax=Dioszegia hungarica TaxID=4972 RepID=A0AA38LVX7_9TREE|nr:uncharacterized protein MKK02DRAFT_42171 [Dioszegia hungarica]KAI9637800.1 hypothetical protein MKK02DRAFT_42171 [Dioszegia hungarica]